eukprot:XP_001695002.1 predicted protein [Chlamydomonas reinhardtii]
MAVKRLWCCFNGGAVDQHLQSQAPKRSILKHTSTGRTLSHSRLSRSSKSIGARPPGESAVSFQPFISVTGGGATSAGGATTPDDGGFAASASRFGPRGGTGGHKLMSMQSVMEQHRGQELQRLGLGGERLADAGDASVGNSLDGGALGLELPEPGAVLPVRYGLSAGEAAAQDVVVPAAVGAAAPAGEQSLLRELAAEAPSSGFFLRASHASSSSPGSGELLSASLSGADWVGAHPHTGATADTLLPAPLSSALLTTRGASPSPSFSARMLAAATGGRMGATVVPAPSPLSPLGGGSGGGMGAGAGGGGSSASSVPHELLARRKRGSATGTEYANYMAAKVAGASGAGGGAVRNGGAEAASDGSASARGGCRKNRTMSTGGTSLTGRAMYALESMAANLGFTRRSVPGPVPGRSMQGVILHPRSPRAALGLDRSARGFEHLHGGEEGGQGGWGLREEEEDVLGSGRGRIRQQRCQREPRCGWYGVRLARDAASQPAAFVRAAPGAYPANPWRRR